MDLPLFVGALLLSLLLSGWLRWYSGRRRILPAPHRTAFAVSAALALLAWCGLYAAHQVAAWSAPTAVAGSLLGGMTATALTMGLAENNAMPPKDVREKVLAFHHDADLHYPAQPAGKRLLDITAALVGIVVTLPFWLVIAALIWLEEPAPVFFTKNSVGRAGRTFRQLKFRTMRYHAEALTGPVSSFPGDPRILRVGSWLRRWHLDELPELINVLAGTMSMVGPRPLRTVLVQLYLEEVPGFAERHTVKPGIACIAQIDKYRMSPHERLRKDRAYLRRMGVRTDLILLWRAVVTTVRRQRDRKEASHRNAPGPDLAPVLLPRPRISRTDQPADRHPTLHPQRRWHTPAIEDTEMIEAPDGGDARPR